MSLYVCNCIFIVSPGGSVRITPLDTTTSFESSENLNCLAQGGPNNTFEWTNSQGQVISNSTQLEFPSITGSDGGIYTCTVTNAAGSDNASTTITGNISYSYITHKHTSLSVISCNSNDIISQHLRSWLISLPL